MNRKLTLGLPTGMAWWPNSLKIDYRAASWVWPSAAVNRARWSYVVRDTFLCRARTFRGLESVGIPSLPVRQSWEKKIVFEFPGGHLPQLNYSSGRSTTGLVVSVRNSRIMLSFHLFRSTCQQPSPNVVAGTNWKGYSHRNPSGIERFDRLTNKAHPNGDTWVANTRISRHFSASCWLEIFRFGNWNGLNWGFVKSLEFPRETRPPTERNIFLSSEFLSNSWQILWGYVQRCSLTVRWQMEIHFARDSHALWHISKRTTSKLVEFCLWNLFGRKVIELDPLVPSKSCFIKSGGPKAVKRLVEADSQQIEKPFVPCFGTAVPVHNPISVTLIQGDEVIVKLSSFSLNFIQSFVFSLSWCSPRETLFWKL